jgi:hypothetical protein
MENLNIIEQALNVANQRGCFTLQESAAILQALTELKNANTKKDGTDTVHVQPSKGI